MKHFTMKMASAIPAVVTALALAVTVAAAALAETEVTQRGKKFLPNEVTIEAGDSVRFINDDNVTHNVHSVTNGHEFDIGGQKVGVATSHTFAEPGKVTVRCAIHPKMKLTVTVN
jgi:plastocyanin